MCSMFLLMMEKSSSPLKLSLFLTLISTTLGLLMYMISSSVFISCCLIISFSSGMMILFSYCSISSFYEYKNNLKNNMWFLLMSLLLLMLMLPQEKLTPSLEKLSMGTYIIPFMLIFLMFMVIVSMKCMNISFFNPTKKLMQSYLRV
uniref:NADH dehydrogenase subunit 6 n=1 Tax=Dermatophagoides pteronyssinus TaxID=6956 RepID=C1IWC7_DERPT|nr:NADH dehydrogenase subunit 6 [Dermatophagoides pteronyssinus]ACF54666.1 NADH dehydrogenase subunit 6 [Dermatophagoides pteronyssinus]